MNPMIPMDAPSYHKWTIVDKPQGSSAVGAGIADRYGFRPDMAGDYTMPGCRKWSMYALWALHSWHPSHSQWKSLGGDGNMQVTTWTYILFATMARMNPIWIATISVFPMSMVPYSHGERKRPIQDWTLMTSKEQDPKTSTLKNRHGLCNRGLRFSIICIRRDNDVTIRIHLDGEVCEEQNHFGRRSICAIRINGGQKWFKPLSRIRWIRTASDSRYNDIGWAEESIADMGEPL